MAKSRDDMIGLIDVIVVRSAEWQTHSDEYHMATNSLLAEAESLRDRLLRLENVDWPQVSRILVEAGETLEGFPELEKIHNAVLTFSTLPGKHTIGGGGSFNTLDGLPGEHTV